MTPDLTTAQLQALKADLAANTATVTINGSPVAINAITGGLRNQDTADAIARWYAQAAVPDFWVWRTRVGKDELTNSTSVDGTTFSWTGAGFITRAQGERDAWRELFSGQGFVNPSLPQVRQAFTDIFSGATAPAPANRTHLSAVSRRKATRAEKLFAAGTGSTAAPAVAGPEGDPTFQNVMDAWSS